MARRFAPFARGILLTHSPTKRSNARYAGRGVEGSSRPPALGGHRGRPQARLRRHRGAAAANRRRPRPAGGNRLPGIAPPRASRVAGVALGRGGRTSAADLRAHIVGQGRGAGQAQRLAGVRSRRRGRARDEGGAVAESGVIAAYLIELRYSLARLADVDDIVVEAE